MEADVDESHILSQSPFWGESALDVNVMLLVSVPIAIKVPWTFK